MNKWLIGGIVGVVAFLIAGVGGYVYLHSTQSVPSTPVTSNQDPFSMGSATSTPVGSLPLLLKSGATIAVPDFTKGAQPAWASAQTGYLVAGTDTGDFLISYVPSDGVAASEFLVTLYAEPLGETRRAAEAALRNRLGVANEALCDLDAIVATGPGVSDTYRGLNLGFSFCSGSVKLP
jgi:hypothetical protein